MAAGEPEVIGGASAARRGIPLFRVFGIRVAADYSWFLIVALVAGTLSAGLFREQLPGRSTLQYVLLGVITAFFHFASVLAHELAHSLVAIRSGIPVRRITLFLFGGMAEISREPPDPRTELRVAAAGPAASAVLAVVLWGAVAAMGPDPGRPGLQLAVFYLAVANTLLLAFNLLPGLPLDGGRLLRAVLWSRTKDLRRATLTASLAGKALAGLLVAVGLFGILSGNFVLSGLWFIFVALFLRQAAEASYHRVALRKVLSGVRVGDVMTEDVVTVSPDITIAALVDEYFLRHHFACYPVIDEGKPVGLIAIKDVKHVPRERWGVTPVRTAMTPLSPEMLLSPREDVGVAIARMAATGAGRLAVVEDGRLAGILTRRDVMSFLEIRSGLAP